MLIRENKVHRLNRACNLWCLLLISFLDKYYYCICYVSAVMQNYYRHGCHWCAMYCCCQNYVQLYITVIKTKMYCNRTKLELWANAQRDGRPAEYRWPSLFNATKFGWRPLLECRAVTLPRCETRWNLQVCPKLTSRSQPLVGRSSPYYQACAGGIAV